MLRLFKIEDGNETTYFDSKRQAKHERDKLNDAGRDVVVMRGPDHRRGESFNVSEQTESSRGER